MRVLATIADSSGEVTEVPNPAPLRATITERRRVGRQFSRRIPGSNGHRAAKAKLARLDRRVVHIRRESHHQLTTMLADTYSEVVIEDLGIAAIKKSMGRRAFRRSVSDAALGQTGCYRRSYMRIRRQGSVTVARQRFVIIATSVATCRARPRCELIAASATLSVGQPTTSPACGEIQRLETATTPRPPVAPKGHAERRFGARG
jgi:hypothetical protein